MSSPVGHSLAGYLVYSCRKKSFSARPDILLFVAAVLAANIPDLDFLPGLVKNQPNLYHHGISHSIGAALIVSIVLALGISLLKKGYSMGKNFLFFLTCYCSHLLFDYLSVDSRPPAGIPVFWPLSSRYLIFPYPFLPPVRHSHLDHATTLQLLTDLLSLHNLYVILLECCIMLPIYIFVFRYVRKETV